jgi:NAD(P)H-nitrite reductase large subunit
MADEMDEKREERIKLMQKVVCICKGINLGRVLKGLEGSETVADVNRKVGTGSGGCQGERCGPRIKMLLRKMKEQQADPEPSEASKSDEDR